MTEQKHIDQMSPWYGKEEAQACYDLIMSGSWLSDFKKCREFEDVICKFTGAKYAVVVPNGTIGLVIALMAVGIGQGDKVIVPDYTMAASPYSVSLVGAEVELVDIEKETYCIDAELAERQLNCSNIKYIMPVSIGGRYPKYNPTFSRDSVIISDICQALGSYCGTKHIGTNHDGISVLSFNVFKNISTGQGGTLITNNKDYYDKIRQIKDFGRKGGRGSNYEMLGMNAKFTDLQAAIGIEQFKKLPWRMSRKKEIYHLYETELADVEQVHFITTNLEECTPWYIDPLVEKRDELIKYLAENGIESQPFYPPVHTLPYYAKKWSDVHDYSGTEPFPNSHYVSEHGIWLPSSSFLSNQDVKRVCEVVKKFYK